MRATEHAKLTNRLTEHIESLGGFRTPEEIYAFALPTPVGILRVTIDADTRILISIFCRFDEPKIAASRLRVGEVNQFSGKWNHHFQKYATAQEVFADFTAALGRLFVKQEVAS